MWDPREDSYIQERAARIEALDQLHQAVVDFSQQFSLDPLIDRVEALEAAQQPAPATEESSATAPPAPAGVQRRYPSPATIAECGGPCDSQGPWACDCGLLDALNPPMPAPAGGLVERVAEAIEDAPHPLGDWRPEARAAIREVVAWLRSEPRIGRAAADRLEQEATQ